MEKTTGTNFKETEIGLIPEEWSAAVLSDVAEIQTGPFGSQLHEADYVEKGTPIITVEHLVNNRIDHAASIPRVSDEDLNRLSKYSLRRGDIVFSRVGSVDRTGYVTEAEEGWLFSGRLLRVRPMQNIDSNFLYYSISQPSIKEHVRSIAVGATMPSLNTKLLAGIPVGVPSISEQHRIASVLSSLDDKIELNRQINANLEKMASALFKRWFVDFEFPDEKGRPYKMSGGKMVETEMGEVPEGWRVGRLGDEFEIIMGQSPNGNTYNEDGKGMPLYQGRTDFGFRFPSRRVYCTEPTRTAKPLDTLISVRAPVGDINMANEECCIGRGVGAIRKNGFSTYTFYTVKSLQSQIAQFDSEGTIFGSINKDSLSDIAFIVPKMSVASSFEKMARSNDEQILSLSYEIDHLTTIRDSLLPRLMSGKIRVNI